MIIKLLGLRFALYARKSLEAVDRQALSLESQILEIRRYAKKNGLNIIRVFEDSASAHQTNNRPAFKEMMEAIASNEIDGILTWDANRLARNMIEGGVIIDLLQRSVIKAIATPREIYLPKNSMINLTIKFGMANQYSLDLSNVVMRGNRRKIELGGCCGLAPLWYLNNKEDKTVVKDSDRFKPVQNLFRLYAKGNYSLKTLCEMATKSGLRSRKGNILTAPRLYDILQNPFYYGEVKKGEA